MARRLAERGRSLLLHVHERRERVRALTTQHPTFDADLAEPEGRRSLTSRVKQHAPLGGLILGASRFSATPLRSVTLRDIQQTLTLELVSHLDLVIHLHPFVADHGRILFFSDVGVRLGWPSYPAYLAAKGALEAAALSLARSLGPRLVITWAAPGALEGAPPPPDGVVTGDTALGRLGRSAEVAEAIVRWLELPAAVIHGRCLRVDGGRGLDL